MDPDGRFLMQKAVDWSLLNDGLTIPVSACAVLHVWDESILTHGACKDIKVLIDGELYEARLKNQNFEQRNWAGHKDVIQIRYGKFEFENGEVLRLKLYEHLKNIERGMYQEL